ncbi:hypothetical protein NL676_039554 [Syzygium grande]|nr:hypothetical protein NL676_039554 [Syzygium grande]
MHRVTLSEPVSTENTGTCWNIVRWPATPETLQGRDTETVDRARCATWRGKAARLWPVSVATVAVVLLSLHRGRQRATRLDV